VTGFSVRVLGMTSRRCVRTVSSHVSDVAGVREVVVDLTTGTLRVLGEADPDAVRAAITEAGYDIARPP